MNITHQNSANRDIREKIDRLGITHWQLAARAGISPTTLSVWMRTPLKPMDPRRVQLMSALSMIEREGKQHGKEEGKSISGR